MLVFYNEGWPNFYLQRFGPVPTLSFSGITLIFFSLSSAIVARALV